MTSVSNRNHELSISHDLVCTSMDALLRDTEILTNVSSDITLRASLFPKIESSETNCERAKIV